MDHLAPPDQELVDYVNSLGGTVSLIVHGDFTIDIPENKLQTLADWFLERELRKRGTLMELRFEPLTASAHKERPNGRGVL